MARILKYPEDKVALRKKCKPVPRVDQSVANLISELKDTLAVHPDGVGLAAPQISAHQRVVIVRLGARIDVDSEPDPPIGLVNPEVLAAYDECKDYDGCLSFPGLYRRTIRPHYLRVSGWDETGAPFDRVFEGFDAVVVHHEIDHLDGVLFIDRIKSMEDLYRIREDKDGRVVSAPVSFVI